MSEAAAGHHCPGCGEPMRREAFERNPFGAVDLDICFACQAIWFDHYESSQLTPGATIELFRRIHALSPDRARPVPEHARCPICRKGLLLTHDIQRTNRFMYHRCPDWHGRFVTFFHFLREKQFVRSLSNAEIERLKVTVKQVRCSSCGAPVAIERDAACSHCRAPLSILDANAVGRTLAELGEKERRGRQPQPAAMMDAFIEGRRASVRIDRAAPVDEGVDLVREALGILAHLL
jgi:hypothetical protein